MVDWINLLSKGLSTFLNVAYCQAIIPVCLARRWLAACRAIGLTVWGDHRVIAEIQDRQLTIVAVSIDHRWQVYA